MMQNGAMRVGARVQQRSQSSKGFGSIAAVIMGAPGSGKGTISGKILRDFPFAHISTGDLLREEIRAGSEVGQKAKSFMDRGAFVPDDVIIKVLVNAVGRAEGGGKHTLLDGFPRSTAQANALKEYLSIDVVMNLDVPRDVILERLTDRWIHPASGRVYAYAYRPPQILSVDEIDPIAPQLRQNAVGFSFIRRSPTEVVEQRLAKYEKTTRPLLDLYDAEGLLHSFSGEKSDVIYKEVHKFLSGKLPHEQVA